MTLQDLGNIGEFVSAIAVVASLVYLAFQIRQNTRQITQNTQAVELSAIDALMNAATESRRSVIENEDVARIYHHGMRDREGLNEIDQTRFRVLMVSVFRAFQSSYQLGFVSGLAPENWRTDRAAVLRLLGQSGARQFWESYKHEFEDGFVKEIDSVLLELADARH